MNHDSRYLPVDPQKVRRIPHAGFGWIDRRFYRLGYAGHLSKSAIHLYFFLCLAANASGHSWYGLPRIGQLVRLPVSELERARRELQSAELVAFDSGLWRVLALPEEPLRPDEPSKGDRSGPSQLGDHFDRILS